MTIIEAILLGALQGLTEFIPVSSSGHLVLAQHFMGLNPSPAFDALVNLGTFLALILYFRKKLWHMAVRIIRHKDWRLARNLFIAAVPVGFAGFVWGDFFESTIVQNPVVVIVMLIVVGVIMIVLESLPKKSMLNVHEDLTPKRVGIVGLAQVVSLIPGTSRSASTMIAGRLMGLNYQQAAEFSFLLSVPVMAGVLLRTAFNPEGVAFVMQQTGAFVASTIAAFACGLFAVSFMLRFLQRGNFKIFGYYRIGLAVIIALLLVA